MACPIHQTTDLALGPQGQPGGQDGRAGRAGDPPGELQPPHRGKQTCTQAQVQPVVPRLHSQVGHMSVRGRESPPLASGEARGHACRGRGACLVHMLSWASRVRGPTERFLLGCE